MAISLNNLGSITLTEYNPSADMSAWTLASAVLTPGTPITITGATYTGANSATSLVKEDGNIVGLLMTSGDGTPPFSNTSTYYGVTSGGPEDVVLQSIIDAVFPSAGSTQDVARLDITFTLSASVSSVTFGILFGSDEYPEWSDSAFVDIAAVIVDGVNYANFNGNPMQPLSVLDVNLGAFIDNTGGAYPIEYDGISSPLTISAPLNPALTTHTITIMVGDTGDSAYDSAIFISSLTGTNLSGSGGTKVIWDGSSADDTFQDLVGLAQQVFLGAGNDTAYGGAGGDDIFGNTGDDVIYGNQDDDYCWGGQDSDIIFGGLGNDVIYGNMAMDILYGNLGDDVIYGGSESDVMFGGQGSDTLFGNLGDDWLWGNLGDDHLHGGGGADTFVFSGAAGQDIIYDFEVGIDSIKVIGSIQSKTAYGDGDTLVTIDDDSSFIVLDVAPDQVNIGFL